MSSFLADQANKP
eukprot:Sro1471_g275410.1 n/a (12) ;mRNA; r:136-173